jgi:acyl phosphate:glycerol-3-phosphate acyltransferase
VTPGGYLVYAAAVAVAYLLGAIPFGFVLVKVFKGVDVRKVGSGNIGATNVARAGGAILGIIAFVLDVAKGFAAATAIPLGAYLISGPSSSAADGFLSQLIAGKGFTDLRMLCGLAAIFGHVWTVFLGFKGGKGVATSLGVLAGLAPLPTGIALAVWIIVTGASSYVSLGSIVAAVALPVAYAAVHHARLAEDWRLFAFTLLVAALVVIRHRANMKRLAAGTESRLSFRGKRNSEG